ncbi:MAG: heme NO-binding domain-containing protein [Cellvibrionaceae bacterium]
MRGVIFTILCDMLEEQHGLPFLNRVIDQANLESGGAYTAGGNYPPEEVDKIVLLLERKLEVPKEFILRSYGEYLLGALAKTFPHFFEVDNLKDFLLGVHGYIHVEVTKLYPDSNLPEFEYSDNNPDRLTMVYRSERKMCHLAEGLIAGAAQYYEEEYSLVQSTCLHRGDDSCQFDLVFYG